MGAAMLSRSFYSALIVAALSSTVFAGVSWAKDDSGWITTRVTEGASGAYCAVSRPIDVVTVTIGRTPAGASSLALEFKDGRLNPQKTYRVSLKPGSSERLDVDTQPISPNVLVLNLDRVVDLQKSFESSPTLQLRYDDQSMALGLPNWTAAAQDLTTCLASLLSEPIKVATADIKPVVPLKQAEKIDVPVKHVAKMEPVVAPERDNSAELTQRAYQLQDENKRLSEILRTTRLDLENALQTSSGAPAAEAQEKIKWLESQNEDLRKKAVTVGTDKTVNDLRATIEALQIENKKMKDEQANGIKEKALLETQLMSARSAPPAPVKDQNAELDQLTRHNEALREENTVLAAKIAEWNKKTEKSITPVVDPAIKGKIDDLTAQIDQLSDQNADLKARLDVKADKLPTPDMKDLQRRNETLAAENVKLRTQLSAVTTPEDDMRVAVAAEMPLRQQLRTLKGENEALRVRNNELLDQLDGKLRANERELLGVSKKNWDMEQATRRFQESEREVKRLSLTMREDRAKCDTEKREIEYMLFDPKLAKAGQIALLNSLEDQLAAARAGQMPTAVAPLEGTQKKSVPILAAVTPPEAQPGAQIVLSLDDVDVVPSRPVDAGQVVAERLDTTPVTKTPPAVPVTSVASPVQGPTLGGLLQKAGVQISRAIAPAGKNPFAPGQAWTWESGEIAGLSVQQPPVQPARFDSTVTRQLNNLKTFCKGEFAAQPAGNAATGPVIYAAYDAACIAGANSTSAAILFYQKDGAFNVISQESAPDVMGKAMDVRDRILNAIGG